MLQLAVYNEEGKESGKIDASDAVFGRKMNKQIIQETLCWFLASRRAGTHGSKTRAEVRGGGKKPWQQKGTGRARAGSNRSPLWRKGGVVFGPKPRDYGYALPIKVRKAALMIALSDKVKENALKVVDAYKIDSAKTRQATAFLKGLGVSGKILCIVGKEDEIFARSARNIADVEVATVNDLNVHNLLRADFIVTTKNEIPKIEEFAGYAA